MKTYIGIITVSLLLSALNANDLDVIKIEPKFDERYINVGDTLTVKCSAVTQSTNKEDLKWTKPSNFGYTFKMGQDTHDANVKKFSDLIIEKMDKSMYGVYTCALGSSTASFELLTPPEEKQQANFTYESKEPITISCKMVGVDSASVEKVVWLKNDTLVSDLSDKKRFTENMDNVTLTISEPTREDADQYYARYYFKNGEPAVYDCGVWLAGAPLVLDFDKSKNLIEDDKMELQCKVKGFPRAEVQWLKNGKVLNATDGSRIIQSPLDGYKNAKLVIKSVQFEDAGDYTCKAYSSYFNTSDSKSLVVRVKDKLAALWPFLGIVGEVVILCTIIFIYEKRRNKQAESEANNAEDVDGSTTDKKEGLRHRNTQSSNPTA